MGFEWYSNADDRLQLSRAPESFVLPKDNDNRKHSISFFSSKNININ